MKYEITRVGVPSRKQDVSQSFLNVVDNIVSGNSISLVTVDFNNPNTKFEYLGAPYGYQYILNKLNTSLVLDNLKYNVLNTYPNIWDIHGGIDPNDSINNFLEYLDSQQEILNFNNVYIFTCGSPLVNDDFTNILLQKIPLNIINCKSPIHICSNNIKDFLNLNKYNIHNIIPYTLDRNVLHVFPGISKNYGINITKVFELFNDLVSPNDVFLYSNILEDGSSYVKSMSFKQALEDVAFFENIEKNLTYGIYTNDNSRTIRSNIS
jgi:hypothetical protein